MSDLEDDVLMAYLALSREMLQMKERNLLIEDVWKDLDSLVRALLNTDPTITSLFGRELGVLRKSVEAVLTFDADHEVP